MPVQPGHSALIPAPWQPAPAAVAAACLQPRWPGQPVRAVHPPRLHPRRLPAPAAVTPLVYRQKIAAVPAQPRTLSGNCMLARGLQVDQTIQNDDLKTTCMHCRQVTQEHLHTSALARRRLQRNCGDCTAFATASPRSVRADIHSLLLRVPLLLGGGQHVRAAQRYPLSLRGNSAPLDPHLLHKVPHCLAPLLLYET